MKILILVFIIFSSGYGDVIVEIPDGKIRGLEVISPAGIPFYSFRGIPYGTPPVGDLRFQAPKPAEKWQGIFNATENGNKCLQCTEIIASILPKKYQEQSEDCLNINVYTPSLNGTKLPVIFYMYGGKFIFGTSHSDFVGADYLIEQDVVVVVFNFRAGPFGFLSTGDKFIPGNAAFKDQVLALQWTNKNIKYFGGDNEKITIVGHSSGAIGVTAHVFSKLSSGLFRAAIVQSGTSLLPVSFQPDPRKNAFEFAHMATKGMDLKNNTSVLLKVLRNMPVKQLQQACTNLIEANWNSGIGIALAVEQEGPNAFMTKSPHQILESGEFSRVPILMGGTDEESLFLFENYEATVLKARMYDENIEEVIPMGVKIEPREKRIKFAHEIRAVYLKPEEKFEDNLHALIKHTSDTVFNIYIKRFADKFSKYADVYYYKFLYDGTMGFFNTTYEGVGKVSHIEELTYLFKMNTIIIENSNLDQFPKEDVLTQKRLLTLWTNFVETMNPTPGKSDLLQNITWPKYTPENESYLEINSSLTVKHNPCGETYNKLKDIYHKYGVNF